MTTHHFTRVSLILAILAPLPFSYAHNRKNLYNFILLSILIYVSFDCIDLWEGVGMVHNITWGGYIPQCLNVGRNKMVLNISIIYLGTHKQTYILKAQ